MSRHNEFRSITLELETARQQGKWRKLVEYGQALLLTPELPDEVRSLARSAVSDGYYRWEDEDELRSLDYDALIAPFNGDIAETIDPADQYWLRGLLHERQLTYRHRGDWRQIMKDLSAAIDLNSLRSEYFIWRARVYERYGRDDTRALLDCRNAVELDSANASCFACRGRIYSGAAVANHPLGDIDKALADYTHALGLEPKWARLYWERAAIYRTLGHEDKALADERSLCEIAPLFAVMCFANRARSGAMVLADEDAIQDANRAVALDPESALAYDSRAYVYASKGEYELAILDHQHAIQTEPNKAKWYLSRADTYWRKKEFELAEIDYNHAIQLEPENADCYSARAFFYRIQNNPEQAIVDYSTAIQIDPQPHFFCQRAAVYERQAQYPLAIKDYTDAIEHSTWQDALFPSILTGRGGVYDKMGDYDNAILDYSKAIELSPPSISSFDYFCRAVIFLKKDAYDNALRDLAKANQLAPETDHIREASETLRTTGVVHGYDGRHEEAIVYLSRAIKVDPQNAEAYRERGKIYLKMGDEERAFEDFVAADEIEPGESRNYASYWEKQAQVEEESGDYAKALVNYTKVIRLYPESRSYERRAELYEKMGYEERAFEDFVAAASTNTSILHRYWAQGQEYEKKGDYASALIAYTRDIVLRSNPFGYFTRGNLHRKMGNLDEAISDLTKAVELEPDKGLYLSQLAYACLDKGDYENAFKTHVKRIELDPSEQFSIALEWRMRGEEHDDNHEYDRAIACYDNLIALDPNDDHIYFMRGAAHYFNHNFSKAVEDFTKAITLDPRHELYYKFRADAYDELGDTARAKADRATANELR